MTDRGFTFGVTPFYFLRHGETHQNLREIVQGQDDTELSLVGRRSAEVAARSLDSIPLGSIYASPLKRAWTTASIVSVLTAAPLFPLPGLKERHWGKYQGRNKDERPAVENPPSVENYQLFSARVLDGMKSITGPSPVLVVTHAGVFRILCQHAGLTLEGRVSVSYGQVLKFEPPACAGETWHISVAGTP